MKRNLSSFVALFAMLLLFASCKEGQKTIFTPVSSGTPYEMLVVMDNATWEAPAGRALFNVLDTNVPGLPQAERSFRISQIEPDNFMRGFKIFRNIIKPVIGEQYTQTKFKYSRDVYSTPQMILVIQSPSEKDFAEYVSKNGQLIIDFFTRAEMNRQIAALEGKHSEMVQARVKDMFNCDLWMPTELGSYKVGKDFLWTSSNGASVNLNCVVYTLPYNDKRTFTREFMLHKRDSVMKANIPGAREGMYMATDTLLTDVKDITVKKQYAKEMRGLWYMEGDMMGGPFVSHARLDHINARVVVVEAFVFSPEKLNRNVMRKMEAALYTLKLPEEDVLNREEEVDENFTPMPKKEASPAK